MEGAIGVCSLPSLDFTSLFLVSNKKILIFLFQSEQTSYNLIGGLGHSRLLWVFRLATEERHFSSLLIDHSTNGATHSFKLNNGNLFNSTRGVAKLYPIISFILLLQNLVLCLLYLHLIARF